jgi:E3 ubiquitin-protein ligase RNF38/44
MGVQCCMTAALLSAFGVFIVMMPLVLAARALRRQGRRYLAFSPDDHPPPWPRQRHVSLASEQISRLPSFESSPYDRNSACVVCLEASRGGERWRALPPCGHAFHAACVDPWLLLSPVCPVCRATVAVPPTGESQAQAADDMETPPPPIYLSLSPPHGGLGPSAILVWFSGPFMCWTRGLPACLAVFVFVLVAVGFVWIVLLL